MEAKSPENRDELEARFQKMLGRAPTKPEMDELVRDKEEAGLGYYDPVLIQLMSFKRERIALEEVFERCEFRSKPNTIPWGRRTPFRAESEQHSGGKSNTDSGLKPNSFRP